MNYGQINGGSKCYILKAINKPGILLSINNGGALAINGPNILRIDTVG